MKHMHFKTVFAALTVAALFFSGLGELTALDVGTNLNSRSAARGDATSLGENVSGWNPTFRNTVSAWVRRRPVVSPSEPSGRFLFESSVTNLIDLNEDEKWESEFVFDVDVLRIDGIFPSVFGTRALLRGSVGRLPVSEPSELVFTDRLDGTALSLDYPNVSLVFAGGYTGLLTGANSGVVMTYDDQQDFVDPDTWHAPHRIIGTSHVGFPNAFGRQGISVGMLAQWDLRQEFDDEQGEKLDSQYLFAKLGGPLVGNLYYDAAVAGSSQLQAVADPESEGLGGTEFGVGLGALLRSRFYFGASDSSVITAEGRFGSAEGNNLTAYTPVTGPSLNLLNSIPGGDSLAFMLDYAWRPFAGEPGSKSRRLELSAYGAASTNADPTADASYQGTEAGTRITYRPLSDLGGRLWLGTYMPSDIDNTEFIGRIEFSSSF